MANRYFVGSGNWNDTTKWSLTSGGATGVAMPTTSDIVYLDGNTGDVVINITNAVCQQFLMQDTFAGSVTIEGTNKVTVSTNVRFSPNATYIGNGFFALGTTSAGTITTNNVVIPWTLQGAGTGIKTFSADLTVGDIIHISNCTWNGFRVFSSGLKSNTTSVRNHYGTTEIWLTGGTWNYVIKRTAGKVVIDGFVSHVGGNNSSGGGLYDNTLEYNSGSLTGLGVFTLGGTNTITIPLEACAFDDLDCSGTTNLNQHIKAIGTLQCAGATSITFNGAGYNIYVSEHLVMYNLGTFLGTAKIVMNGTGTVFRPTSLNGMTFNGLSPLGIDLEIDTEGTITFFNLPAYNQFGGGRTLTYKAGAVITTGCTFKIATGGYNFDINNAFPISNLLIDTSNPLTSLSNTTALSTRQLEGASLYVKSGTSFTASSLFVGGNDLLTTKIANTVGEVSDFVAGNTCNVVGSSALVNGIIPNTGKMLNMLGATGNLLTPINLNTVFTIAFTLTDPAPNTIIMYADASNQIYVDGNGKLVTVFQAFNSYVSLPNITTAGTNRFVISRNGAPQYMFKNGVPIGWVNWASAKTFNNISLIGSNSSMGIDELVLFTVSKAGAPTDVSWVSPDYNGGAGKVYDSLEAGIVNGWHFDENIANGKLIYNGTDSNLKISNATFENVDASQSDVPIYDWHGSVVNSDNVFAVTGDNIGGQPQAFVKINGVKKKINLAVTKV